MKLSKICCQASINTYGGEHGKVKHVLSDVFYFNDRHVEAHVGTWEDKTILVFRGSDGWKDWFDNFRFWKTRTPKEWFGKSYRLHKGMVSQTERIYDEVMALASRSPEIVITGHSLGGALGTIFAGILTKKGVKVRLITFGSPRIGTINFAKWFDKSVHFSIRYKYGEDTITKVPPLWMGYKHVSSKVQLGRPSWKEILLYPIRKIFGNPYDHEPIDYISALQKKY